MYHLWVAIGVLLNEGFVANDETKGEEEELSRVPVSQNQSAEKVEVRRPPRRGDAASTVLGDGKSRHGSTASTASTTSTTEEFAGRPRGAAGSSLIGTALISQQRHDGGAKQGQGTLESSVKSWLSESKESVLRRELALLVASSHDSELHAKTVALLEDDLAMMQVERRLQGK